MTQQPTSSLSSAEATRGPDGPAPAPAVVPLGGRYTLLEEIARGGMGIVYRASDTVLDREVAVKVLHERLEADPRLAEASRTSHCYTAACYAALAARGEGVGAPTEPRERAALRARALAWLKADLAVWKDQANSKQVQNRQLAEGDLAHWLVDEDLRQTRPEAKREGWTEQESKAWDQLWSAVRQTLEEAGQKQDRPG
jgi:serine/threonine protein kinase